MTTASTTLRLGAETFDVTHRALVMGILNRTTDSFYDRGAHFALDVLLRRADELVAGGADVLDVGARSAGVGTREVSEAEEAELVTSTVEALRCRFDVPISVDTWRASVAEAGLRAGASLANDVSGFRDREYLCRVSAAGGSVVATHMRLAPQVPDPDPRYDDVVLDVCEALDRLASAALAAGLGRDRIILDPGLDLGKTWQQSVELLAGTERFCRLGHPVLVAPSNKIFLGRLLGLERDERRNATVAACTAAILAGARIVRVHESRDVRQAADLCEAMLASTG